MYPAYHRQHHTRHYGFEDGFDGIKAKAREMNDTLFDYLEGQLSPNLLGGEICAADFYLYMLTRWEPNKDQMRTGRPKLAAFLRGDAPTPRRRGGSGQTAPPQITRVQMMPA